MDGVGYGKYEEGDAVKASKMKYLDWFTKNCPHTQLKAHGTAVGLPTDDDMGNSEVGHNAMGCGRVFAQGAKLVGESISSGSMFEGAVWKKLVKNVQDKGTTFHLMGLVSDGNVHSHIDHLKAMITQAHKEGVAFTHFWTVAMFHLHLLLNILSLSRNSLLSSALLIIRLLLVVDVCT